MPSFGRSRLGKTARQAGEGHTSIDSTVSVRALPGGILYKALQKLGRETADVLVKSGMTEEQKKKYRLLDNKTSELAGWDFEKLALELDGLDFGDFDFGFDSDSFEWEDLVEDMESKEKEPKKIQCPHCGEWFET